MSGELNAAVTRRHPDFAVRVSPLRQKENAGAGEVVLGRYATVADEAEAIGEQHTCSAGDPARRAGSAAGQAGPRDGTDQEPTTVAILCRRRAQFAPLQTALEARRIPYEIVGLGGLLGTPGDRGPGGNTARPGGSRAGPTR